MKFAVAVGVCLVAISFATFSACKKKSKSDSGPVPPAETPIDPALLQGLWMLEKEGGELAGHRSERTFDDKLRSILNVEGDKLARIAIGEEGRSYQCEVFQKFNLVGRSLKIDAVEGNERCRSSEVLIHALSASELVTRSLIRVQERDLGYQQLTYVKIDEAKVVALVKAFENNKLAKVTLSEAFRKFESPPQSTVLPTPLPTPVTSQPSLPIGARPSNPMATLADVVGLYRADGGFFMVSADQKIFSVVGFLGDRYMIGPRQPLDLVQVRVANGEFSHLSFLQFRGTKIPLSEERDLDPSLRTLAELNRVSFSLFAKMQAADLRGMLLLSQEFVRNYDELVQLLTAMNEKSEDLIRFLKAKSLQGIVVEDATETMPYKRHGLLGVAFGFQTALDEFMRKIVDGSLILNDQ